MTVHICDVCRKEKLVVLAKWKVTFRRGAERFGVDLCEEHKDWSKGKTYEGALNLFIE
jgi:hypothetical protein